LQYQHPLDLRCLSPISAKAQENNDTTKAEKMPNTKSPIVSGPINAKGKINVAAFDKNGRKGHKVQ